MNRNSELQEKKVNIARENKRKAKKAMNLSDDKFYKKELRGLSVTQKTKMIRKRNQLIEKEKRKNRKNAVDKAISSNDSEEKKSLVRNAGVDGYPSTLKKDNNAKSKFDGISNENLLKDTVSEPKDLNARMKLLGKIKSIKRKNTRKKIKKRTKRTLRILSIPFGFSFVIVLVSLFSTMIIFAGGMVASVAVSHPAIVKELYDTGVLGDVNTVTNLYKDVKVGNKVIAEGIGDKSTAGNFSYFGEYNDGTGVYSGGKTNNKDSESKDDTSSGDSVKEADESQMSGKIWNKLRSMGYSKQATAGVMGNIQQESQFDINAFNGSHKGLFQWDLYGRYANATKFCKEKGQDITKDFGCQLEFADKELSAYNFGNHRTKSFDGFKKSDSIQNVVYDFEELFERSGGSAMDKRVSFANALFEKYGK